MRYNDLALIARAPNGSTANVCWLDRTTRIFQWPIAPGVDTWHMVMAQGSALTPIPNLVGGCNALAAANGVWMGRLDGAQPPLRGSQSWSPSDGRVGDVHAVGAAVLSVERDTVTLTPTGGNSVTFPISLFGDLRLWDNHGEPALAYVQDPGPTLQLRDRWGRAIEAQHWPGVYTALAYREPDGTLWVAYQTDALGGVLHMAADRTRGYRWGTPMSIYNPDYCVTADGFTLGWSTDPGEFSQQSITIPVLGQGMVPLAPTAPPPPPPPLPPKGPTVTNPLRIAGKEFYRGDSLFVPRFTSALKVLTKSRDDMRRTLDYARGGGFNGVRVFGGALTWARQTPASALSAASTLLEEAVARDLVVEMTVLTDTASGYDPYQHLVRFRDVLLPYKGMVLTELANEFGHSTQSPELTGDRLRQWGRELFAPHGLLWAVGAPVDTDEPTPAGYFDGHGGDYITSHLERGRDGWNNVRRVRELYAIVESYGVPVLNNEPMGADEQDGSVTGKQRWNDPALFYTMGALERAFPGVGGVHHSQAGLHAELPGPIQAQCANAYLAGHRDVARALPERGTYKNVGHDGSPYMDVPVGEQPGAQVVRAYSFLRGDNGVAVLVGKVPHAAIPTSNGWGMGGFSAVSTMGPEQRHTVVQQLRKGGPSGGLKPETVAEVTAAYAELLQRTPDPYGLAYYGTRLEDGRMTPATMRDDIRASAEYRDKHPQPPQPPQPPTPPPPAPPAPSKKRKGGLLGLLLRLIGRGR